MIKVIYSEDREYIVKLPKEVSSGSGLDQTHVC